MKRVFQYQYDSSNRLIRFQADDQVSKFEYDAAGNLTARWELKDSTSGQPIATAQAQTGYCDQCGAKMTANARFCAHCGQPVND